MDKEKIVSSNQSDSGYSSGSFSPGNLSRFLKKRDNEIAKSFYQLIHGPFYSSPKSWKGELEAFKQKFENIQYEHIGKITNSKIVFSWKSLDQIIARDRKSEQEPESFEGISLRIIADSNAAFEKGMFKQIISEYEKDYSNEKSLKDILLVKDYLSSNVLHCLANRIANRAKFGQTIELSWEAFKEVRSLVPELAAEKDQFGDLPLDIIENEGISIDQKVVYLR